MSLSRHICELIIYCLGIAKRTCCLNLLSRGRLLRTWDVTRRGNWDHLIVDPVEEKLYHVTKSDKLTKASNSAFEPSHELLLAKQPLCCIVILLSSDLLEKMVL